MSRTRPSETRIGRAHRHPGVSAGAGEPARSGTRTERFRGDPPPASEQPVGRSWCGVHDSWWISPSPHHSDNRIGGNETTISGPTDRRRRNQHMSPHGKGPHAKVTDFPVDHDRASATDSPCEIRSDITSTSGRDATDSPKAQEHNRRQVVPNGIAPEPPVRILLPNNAIYRERTRSSGRSPTPRSRSPRRRRSDAREPPRRQPHGRS